ncbi:MAG: fimbrillin family protein [Bacteroidales bacterium]|nr:fimbrillin family protein [Bacteroidales bacterium]
MKKVLTLAALACMMLAACTKNERIAEPARDIAISFSPISQRTVTRAEYYGEQNATYTGSPIAGATASYEKFLAYAAYTEAANTSGIAEFFPAAGVACEYEPAGYPTGSDFWAPAQACYWPKAGYLTFHAFSPAVLAPVAGTVTNDWANGVTLTGFTATTDMDKQVDVLYSDFNKHCQRSQYSPETGFTYDDKTGDAASHKGVDIIFRHALSAVQFRVVTDQDYTTGTQTHAFTVKQIKVINVASKGEFHENRVGTFDNAYGDAPQPSITFNKDNTDKTATPYWITGDTVTDYVVFSGSQAVSAKAVSDAVTTPANVKEFGLYGKMMLPMPQELDHGTEKVIVEVTYDYTFNDGTTDHNYTGLTTRVELVGKVGVLAGNAYTVNQWLINHKYLYTLVFKLDPIIFDPKVEAFVEVTDINIDLPYQN